MHTNFHGKNFGEKRVSHETHENVLPQNFAAIPYIYNYDDEKMF